MKIHLQEDEVCNQMVAYCEKGWPEKCSLKGLVKLDAPFAAEPPVKNGLLLKGSRLVVPASMRLDMFDKLHAGHQGIVKCHVRARESVWWPGIGRKLEDLVNGCSATVQREYGESSFIMSMPNGQLRQGKKHQLPAQRNGNRGPTIFTAAHGESCNSCL